MFEVMFFENNTAEFSCAAIVACLQFSVGNDPGAQAGQEIILKKFSCPPFSLNRLSEHPKSQHIEGQVKDTAMKKHIGNCLPEP